jgi:hypothetical protein
MESKEWYDLVSPLIDHELYNNHNFPRPLSKIVISFLFSNRFENIHLIVYHNARYITGFYLIHYCDKLLNFDEINYKYSDDSFCPNCNYKFKHFLLSQVYKDIEICLSKYSSLDYFLKHCIYFIIFNKNEIDKSIYHFLINNYRFNDEITFFTNDKIGKLFVDKYGKNTGLCIKYWPRDIVVTVHLKDRCKISHYNH